MLKVAGIQKRKGGVDQSLQRCKETGAKTPRKLKTTDPWKRRWGRKKGAESITSWGTMEEDTMVAVKEGRKRVAGDNLPRSQGKGKPIRCSPNPIGMKG